MLARYRFFVRLLAILATLVVIANLYTWSVPKTMQILAKPSAYKQPSGDSHHNHHEDGDITQGRAASLAINLSVEGDEQGLKGKCVAVRVKGYYNATMDLNEAVQLLAQHNRQDRPIHVGLIFSEEPGGFISSGKVADDVGVFHLYHYLEFLLVAYQQLMELQNKLGSVGTVLLSDPDASIRVPWIYVPLLQAPHEVCGVADGMNCKIASELLQSPQWFGMESNPTWLQDLHPSYRGQHSKRQWNVARSPLVASDNYGRMQATADVVLLLSLRHRDRCNHVGRTQNGWNRYVEHFPMYEWHHSLVQQLEKVPLPLDLPVSQPNHHTRSLVNTTQSQDDQMTICYVDRQATTRRMPDTEHAWLVDYLRGHPQVRFWHLNMQNYSGLQQVKISTQCSMLIGVHGNGISHLLWMHPQSYVLETYWDSKRRQGGYEFLARTLNHTYLAIRRGYRVLDGTNPLISEQLELVEGDALMNGRQVTKEFVKRALRELGLVKPRAREGKVNHALGIPMGQFQTSPEPAVTPAIHKVGIGGDTHPRDCDGAAKHIHLAVGRNPKTEMTVSFASKWSDNGDDDMPVAGVRYGTRPDNLDRLATQESTPLYYNTSHPPDSQASAGKPYYSPYYHHITIRGLQPGTTYFYIPVTGPRNWDNSLDDDLMALAAINWRDHPTQDLENYYHSDQTDRLVYSKNRDAPQGRRVLAPKPYNGIRRECPEPNRVRSFTTARESQEVRFGIIGDLGQFAHSEMTLMHMLKNADTMDAIMLVGDIGYTNNNHHRWDTFFDFLDDYPLFQSTPLQIATGNHDIEKAVGRNEIFQAYENRFRMPQVRPAELGTLESTSGDLLNMNEPPYPLPYEWGNAYYSFDYGPAKHVVISAYSSMEPDSQQYRWLVQELDGIDRELSPWVLVTIHVPLYNTYKAHLRDAQILAAKEHLEPLFVQQGVNMVFAGHIHAYQRTKPVAFGKASPTGPIHVTVGASGRQCCRTAFLNEEPENWVAERDGSHYGYGQLTIYNKTHAEWQWIPTSFPDMKESDDLPRRDVVMMENQYFSNSW